MGVLIMASKNTSTQDKSNVVDKALENEIIQEIHSKHDDKFSKEVKALEKDARAMIQKHPTVKKQRLITAISKAIKREAVLNKLGKDAESFFNTELDMIIEEFAAHRGLVTWEDVNKDASDILGGWRSRRQIKIAYGIAIMRSYIKNVMVYTDKVFETMPCMESVVFDRVEQPNETKFNKQDFANMVYLSDISKRLRSQSFYLLVNTQPEFKCKTFWWLKEERASYKINKNWWADYKDLKSKETELFLDENGKSLELVCNNTNQAAESAGIEDTVQTETSDSTELAGAPESSKEHSESEAHNVTEAPVMPETIVESGAPEVPEEPKQLNQSDTPTSTVTQEPTREFAESDKLSLTRHYKVNKYTMLAVDTWGQEHPEIGTLDRPELTRLGYILTNTPGMSYNEAINLAKNGNLYNEYLLNSTK